MRLSMRLFLVANFVERRKGEVRNLGILGRSHAASCIAPALLLPLGARMPASRDVDWTH
jgi:hypothetical protein